MTGPVEAVPAVARRPIPEARVRSGLAAWGLADAPLRPLPAGASGEVFLVEGGGAGDERWVAKYVYMARDDVVPGLLAAGVVAADGGFRAAAPRRTARGELVAMVEWPDGIEHPLCVLEWVDGRPLDRTTLAGAGVVGRTLGRVQSLLLSAGPERLGLGGSDGDYLAYLRSTDQHLGEYAWLHDRIRELVAEVDGRSAAGDLTVGPGVWDGPEILVDDRDGTIGLVDFGNTDLHPVAHVVGYGTTSVSPPGREDAAASDAFLAAFSGECPISPADRAATPLFRLVSLAIYAKFMAARRADGRLAPGLDDALARSAAALRR